MPVTFLDQRKRFATIGGRFRPSMCVFISLGLTLMVEGCAVKQLPPHADIVKNALPPETSVPTSWKLLGSIDGPVIVDWVPTFHDPQLEVLVAEGLKNNLDLRAASARVEIAQGLVKQSRSQLYPNINMAGGLDAVGREDIFNSSGIEVELSWEADIWGRIRAQVASARANQQMSEADLLYARQSLAALVAKLWFQAIATEELRTTAHDATAVNEELLRLVLIKNRIGQVGKQDVALAQSDLERARRRELQFASSEQQIVRALETILGRYPSHELALAKNVAALPPSVPSGIPSEIMERRPDLISAERRVASSFYGIQSAQAARLPRIILTASGGRSSNDLLYLANVSPNFWQVGANFLAPIYNAGALKAQVKIATAEQKIALALYGQMALRAFSEVETALANEELLSEQQHHAESVLEQDTEALRLGRIRYDVGSTNLLSVLQLEARQIGTQFDLISLRNDRLANRVALHLALGGGFTPAAP
jgi:outer membrane protein, multidrug efflux system